MRNMPPNPHVGFCKNKGDRARDSGGDVRLPPELHEGRAVQPPGPRPVRGRDGLLRGLFFLGSARDGEKNQCLKDAYCCGPTFYA